MGHVLEKFRSGGYLLDFEGEIFGELVLDGFYFRELRNM